MSEENAQKKKKKTQQHEYIMTQTLAHTDTQRKHPRDTAACSNAQSSGPCQDWATRLLQQLMETLQL